MEDQEVIMVWSVGQAQKERTENGCVYHLCETDAAPWSAPTVMQDLSGTGGMNILEKMQWRTVLKRQCLPYTSDQIIFRMLFHCGFSGDT